MSQRISTWNRKKLNAFTRTDIKIIVLLPPVSPRLARPPTQRSGGAEVDVGDDASVVRRRGRAMRPRVFLRQLPSNIPQYWGPPDPLFGVTNQVCTWEHVSLFCYGENAGCHLNSDCERGQPGDEECPAGRRRHNSIV